MCTENLEGIDRRLYFNRKEKLLYQENPCFTLDDKTLHRRLDRLYNRKHKLVPVPYEDSSPDSFDRNDAEIVERLDDDNYEQVDEASDIKEALQQDSEYSTEGIAQ